MAGLVHCSENGIPMIDFEKLYLQELKRRADTEFYAERLEADHAELREKYAALSERYSVVEIEYRRLYAIVHRPNFAQEWVIEAAKQKMNEAHSDKN